MNLGQIMPAGIDLMKFFLLFLCICLAALTISAQPGKTKTPVKKPAAQTSPKKPAVAKSTPKKTASKPGEKDEFEKAMAVQDLEAKVDALKKFIAEFPKSKNLAKAKEALTAAAYAFAEENLSVGEVETAWSQRRTTLPVHRILGSRSRGGAPCAGISLHCSRTGS